MGVHLRPHNRFQKRVRIDCDHFVTILFLKRRNRQKMSFGGVQKCRTIGSRLSLGEKKRAQLKGKRKRKNCDALTEEQVVLAFRDSKERVNVNAQGSIHRRTNRECSIPPLPVIYRSMKKHTRIVSRKIPVFPQKTKFYYPSCDYEQCSM